MSTPNVWRRILSAPLFAVSVVLVTLAALLTWSATSGAATPAIISNGTVQLGINPTGDLNVPGPASAGGIDEVGIRYVPTNNDATSPGCLCEGWGAADATSGVTGSANQDSGVTPNLVVDSFVSTATTATSVVTIDNSATPPVGVLKVTHEYKPSATPNLYEVTVTIENLSGATVDPRYRRVMDWDVEPTAFAEYSTIAGTATAANVTFASDDGFASADPLAGPSHIDFTGDAVDNGPDDHGALFDFKFDPLAPGASVTFKTFYGAAGNEADAKAALGAVGAEVYSLGQPSTPDGPTLGTPNTFIFAFAGVGGTAQVPAVRFKNATSTVAESAGTATIAVELTAAVATPVTVDYATADDTATAGSDYTAASGTLAFPANATMASFSVPILDDTAAEGPETVKLTLSKPSAGVVLGLPKEATLTITDDDSGTTSTTTSTSTTSTTSTSTSTTSTSTSTTSTSTTSTSTTSTTVPPEPPETNVCRRPLRVSTSRWREDSRRLDGAEVGRHNRMSSLAIFLAPAWRGIPNLEGVDFTLDGEAVRTEYETAYDLMGTAWWGGARMLDATTLADGEHTVTATVRRSDEAPCVATATFTVDNSRPHRRHHHHHWWWGWWGSSSWWGRD